MSKVFRHYPDHVHANAAEEVGFVAQFTMTVFGTPTFPDDDVPEIHTVLLDGADVDQLIEQLLSIRSESTIETLRRAVEEA